jgi:hypothetical protein
MSKFIFTATIFLCFAANSVSGQNIKAAAFDMDAANGPSSSDSRI